MPRMKDVMLNRKAARPVEERAAFACSGADVRPSYSDSDGLISAVRVEPGWPG